MVPLPVRLAAGFVFIILNGLFVLTEFALVRIRTPRLELLARRGDSRAVLVQAMLQSLDLYLSALQMGITMSSLALGWVGEPAVAAVLGPALSGLGIPWSPGVIHSLSFVLAFAVITFLHILFGELIPRSIGIQKAETVALWMAYPLKAYTGAFRLPIAVMTGLSIRILRLMRMTPASEADTQLTEEEVRVLLGSSDEKGGFSLERLMLIENIFDFGQAKVSEAMVPAHKVAVLSLAKSWEENREILRSRRFSRYPLCKEGLDTAVGYVHVKEIALAAPAPPDLASLRRDLYEIPAGESLQRLLQFFANRGTHIALVRDAHKKPAGIVTLEDILEEIVGEVHDEFDVPHAWSLMDVLIPAGVEVGVDVPDLKSLIARMIARLKAAHPALDAEEAMRVVWERESRFPTAVGHGVAIPHGRLPSLDRPLVALARAPKAFPFPSPDKAPVRLAFLVLTPAASPVAQLKVLSRIASLLSNDNLRRRLLRVKSAESLVELLKTADRLLAS